MEIQVMEVFLMENCPLLHPPVAIFMPGMYSLFHGFVFVV
jgi:hypothetical protein